MHILSEGCFKSEIVTRLSAAQPRNHGSNSRPRLVIFSSPQCSDQLWVFAAFHSKKTRGTFPGSAEASSWSYQSPPSSAEIKNEWNYISTLLSVLTAYIRTTLPLLTLTHTCMCIVLSFFFFWKEKSQQFWIKGCSCKSTFRLIYFFKGKDPNTAYCCLLPYKNPALFLR